ncbi:MAG: VWA domain-containing protein [Cyclobacteriaceae bacterium]|nr:VWA domain-containing protein [Cyclobacteriaceae bacterium HetDA_MAG_MS6]
MIWAYGFSALEVFFVVSFIVLYGAYILRIIRISKKLNTPGRRVALKVALRAIYFALFIVALLGPSFGDTSKEIKSVGKDLFFCIDLSESMNAFDVQPTRLEKVKFELKNIVEAFSSDRIGLIMFSNEAFMQCPLTYDNNALNLFIQTLNTSLVPNTGTDFGPPLKMALKKLRSEEGGVTQQKSKIIVLISDGEDFGTETSEVAEEIESDGIKLFTLGVGTKSGSKILTRRGYKTNREGQEVISQLNSTSLKKLASDTGGKYFEINKSKNDVSRLINTINEIEGELRDSKQMDVKSNKYYYFLGLAILLLLIDSLVHIRVLKI